MQISLSLAKWQFRAGRKRVWLKSKLRLSMQDSREQQRTSLRSARISLLSKRDYEIRTKVRDTEERTKGMANF